MVLKFLKRKKERKKVRMRKEKEEKENCQRLQNETPTERSERSGVRQNDAICMTEGKVKKKISPHFLARNMSNQKNLCVTPRWTEQTECSN